MRRCGKYVAEIRNPATRSVVWLGTYYNAVDAAMAYDSTARRIHGAKARTNFPLKDGRNMQSFVHNGVELSPLDLTLAPPRNFPIECYHRQRQFCAVHSLSQPRRHATPTAEAPLGLCLSQRSMLEIIQTYEELLQMKAVQAQRDVLDLDLNRPPPWDEVLTPPLS
ncbi:ethylene-responsive transcription factor 9-like [Olea europaea var. sylvestris]|nr:ethylene-responsive transcription factor 9-like [Olea europaea var. sylvestris]